MKPLRVAMLTQMYLPFIGGAELQLASILRRLPALGIEACVITRHHDESPLVEDVDGIRVQRIEVGKRRVLASLSYTAKAVLALNRLKPDIVHAHELRSPSTTAVAYRMLSGTPVVAKVLRGGTLGDLKSLSKTSSDRMRLRQVLARIDGFAVISSEIDVELAAYAVPDARRHFIPNGVDTDRFTLPEPALKAQMKAKLGLGAGPVALFAGRLEHEKRIDRLVAIWPMVRAQVPDAVLAVLGTGSLGPALSKGAPEGVHLAGAQIDMLPWYQAADGFVLPSEAEGLSNAMLEAMAMGLPCVATAVGAAPDLLQDGLGRLVPVDDDPALIASIVKMLKGTAEPDRVLTQRLRARIEQDYGLDETARRLAALYRNLARR